MATLVGTIAPLDYGTVAVGTKTYRKVDVTLKGEDAALVSQVGLHVTALAGSGDFHPSEIWVKSISGA